MASEYPGIQHIREGASGETVFLLNLLDTLYGDADELEQQLVQAREERDEQMQLANRLQADLHEVIRQRSEFYEQRDQAREENERLNTVNGGLQDALSDSSAQARAYLASREAYRAESSHLKAKNAQAQALLASIEHIIAQNSDYQQVTEWRDQYTAWLARKE